VAVGRDGRSGIEQSDAAVWTSVDGLTWSRVPHDEAVLGGEGRQRMLSVTAGGPGLVAVGSDGPPQDPDADRYDELAADAAVWTSVDGLTWSRVRHAETVFGGLGEQRMDGVTVGGPGLVAVGSAIGNGHAAAVWTSPDGLIWSRVPDGAFLTGEGEGPMLSVTAAGPGLVAVGITEGPNAQCWEEAVWTSADGLTWSRLPVLSQCGNYERMVSVTVGDHGLVAVGSEADDSAAVWVVAFEPSWHCCRTSSLGEN
jgi:hypothetical protein